MWPGRNYGDGSGSFGKSDSTRDPLLWLWCTILCSLTLGISGPTERAINQMCIGGTPLRVEWWFLKNHKTSVDSFCPVSVWGALNLLPIVSCKPHNWRNSLCHQVATVVSWLSFRHCGHTVSNLTSLCLILLLQK